MLGGDSYRYSIKGAMKSIGPSGPMGTHMGTIGPDKKDKGKEGPLFPFVGKVGGKFIYIYHEIHRPYLLL